MEAVVGSGQAEGGVSSVVGTVLMLAVTIAVFGGLSVVVLAEIRSTESPPEADLAFVSEGTRAILTHRGGDPVPLEGSFLLLNVAGAEVRVEMSDASIASQTADGKSWRIGETLCLSGPSPANPARTCLVAARPILGVAVIGGGGLLADEGERGGDAGPCVLDGNAPTVPSPWTLTPVDVMTTTTGAVTVGFTATDDCSGPDDTVEPVLSYRIDDGSSPAYTSLGQMTNTGPGQWEGTVPAQSWNLLGGKTLQFYATGLQDANGNQAGATAVQSQLIDTVTLIAYVSGVPSPTTGDVGSLDPARDSSDSEAATLITEAGTTTPAGSATAKFSGTTHATSGGATPENVLASENLRAEVDAVDEWIEVTGFDLPSNAATVTSVTIGYEGYKESSGGSDPSVRLDYKIGAGTYSLGTATPESAAADTMRTRVLTGTFTVSQVEAMTVRVYLAADAGARDLLIDHIFATVGYTTSAVTTYSLSVQLDFADSSDGSSETVELRYKTAGDTYRVEVWNGASYTDRGTLSSASFATFSYQLAAAEFNGGAPRIRITDVTPAGTSAGSLQLDYARVVTV